MGRHFDAGRGLDESGLTVAVTLEIQWREFGRGHFTAGLGLGSRISAGVKLFRRWGTYLQKSGLATAVEFRALTEKGQDRYMYAWGFYYHR